jgi:hypothetical protein
MTASVPQHASGQVRCPHCGALNRPGDSKCWLCREPLASDALQTGSPPTPASDAAAGQGAGLMALVTIALIVVLVGMFPVFPGLALLLLIVATPVLLHAFLGTRQQAAGEPPGTLTATAGFLGTVGIVLAVLLSAITAFAVVCFPVGLLGFFVGFEQSDQGREAVGTVLIIGAWPLGILVAVFVAVRATRLFARRKAGG